nr:MAG: replication initiator protein [Microviridae sp.]
MSWLGRFVPCGHCVACRTARSREWAVRIMHELKYWDKSCFITLTYDWKNLPKDHGLCKKDLQDFWKRLRKHEKGVKIRYFACGEYGEERHRPHYHAIVLGLGAEAEPIIGAAWGNGLIYVGTVTLKSTRYVADYMCKATIPPNLGNREEPFQCISQGLGRRYAEISQKQMCESGFISHDGVKMGIPRYYIKIMKELPFARNAFFIAERQDKSYEKSVEFLKRHAEPLGLDPDMRTWTKADKRRVYQSVRAEGLQRGRNIEARAGMYKKGSL